MWFLILLGVGILAFVLWLIHGRMKYHAANTKWIKQAEKDFSGQSAQVFFAFRQLVEREKKHYKSVLRQYVKTTGLPIPNEYYKLAIQDCYRSITIATATAMAKLEFFDTYVSCSIFDGLVRLLEEAKKNGFDFLSPEEVFWVMMVVVVGEEPSEIQRQRAHEAKNIMMNWCEQKTGVALQFSYMNRSN